MLRARNRAGQLRLVQPDGLARKQVERNGIRAEDVDHEELIALLGHLAKPSPGIAQDDINCCSSSAAVRQIREETTTEDEARITHLHTRN